MLLWSVSHYVKDYTQKPATTTFFTWFSECARWLYILNLKNESRIGINTLGEHLIDMYGGDFVSGTVSETVKALQNPKMTGNRALVKPWKAQQADGVYSNCFQNIKLHQQT